MSTMIVTMSLDPARSADVDRHFREDVVPWARTRPGFVSGRFLRSPDGTQGMGVVVFATAEDAESAAAGPRSAPAGPAWSVTSVDLMETVEQVRAGPASP